MLVIATVLLLSGSIGLFEYMIILAVAILVIGLVIGIGGIVANVDFILICTYEANGANPELVIYKKR